jgi:hypothetical protein
MKRLAIRGICVPQAWVYIGNGKELQDNSSVPAGPRTEQSEATGVQDSSLDHTGSLTEQGEPIHTHTHSYSCTDRVCVFHPLTRGRNHTQFPEHCVLHNTRQ